MNLTTVIVRRISRVALFILALLALCVFALGASIPYAMTGGFDPGAHGASAQTALIANVDVLTMADRDIRRRQFVLIEDGHIVSISEAPPPQTEGLATIDGHGLTLMPGLIDMHTHIFDRTDLVNYLTSGVTTVRNMMGMPMHLRWREEIATGAMPGPRLVTASPTLNGGEFAPFHVFPRNEAEARSLVRQYQTCGYDFIKVYDGLSPAVFSAVTEEARSTGLDVTGHLPRALSLGDTLATGMISIEHAEEIYSTLLVEDGAEGRLEGIADQIAASGTAFTPTLVAYRNLQLANADPDGFLASVDTARINPVVRFFGHRSTADMIAHGKPERMSRKMRLMTALTRRLYERGAAVLLGSDTGPAFTVAGRSLHDEIDLLSAAGIDPYAILYSGTGAAAEALHRSGEIGVIAPGARAEFILVAGSPLDDLSTLRRPRGVLMNGRYYDRAALDLLERSGTNTMSTYRTIGWLLWHQLTGGANC